MILLFGFKLWRCVSIFVLKLFNMRKRMNITGREQKTYSDEELSDGITSYSLSFSQESSYTNFEIFGKEFIEGLLSVDGAKGLKMTNIVDYSGQTALSLVAVDQNGNELDAPATAAKDAPQDPPPTRCPNSCG